MWLYAEHLLRGAVISAGAEGVHLDYAEVYVIRPGHAVHISDIVRTGIFGFSVHIGETVGSVWGVGYAVLVGDI